MKLLDVKKIIIDISGAVVLYLDKTLWKIIDLYLVVGDVVDRIGFGNSDMGRYWPRGVNFGDTLRSVK